MPFGRRVRSSICLHFATKESLTDSELCAGKEGTVLRKNGSGRLVVEVKRHAQDGEKGMQLSIKPENCKLRRLRVCACEVEDGHRDRSGVHVNDE